MRGFLSHGKTFGCYSKCRGILLKDFKQKRNIVFEGNHSMTSKLYLIIANVTISRD